ncbi:hypothetical protein GOP47_0003755 [Adiantum capillus-veneris]|uniref:Uncharacterized protein n=1 Tax=Adiantum capillus-veneris TaxID=13818 RepID=A0A9D4ZNV3_ADICA|nr:hypothetical protein GOP47_0003755 [Adiantum capillus-veneris]
MASRSTVKYTMDRVFEYIRDPLFWRGPIPANDVVHILEDFDVIRKHYYPAHLLVGLYESTCYLGLIGYYHVALELDEAAGRGHVSLREIGYQRPINALPSFGFEAENWKVRMYAVDDTPRRLGRSVQYIGPWVLRVRNRVYRKLCFQPK